jgi:hypothetical protein
MFWGHMRHLCTISSIWNKFRLVVFYALAAGTHTAFMTHIKMSSFFPLPRVLITPFWKLWTSSFSCGFVYNMHTLKNFIKCLEFIGYIYIYPYQNLLVSYVHNNNWRDVKEVETVNEFYLKCFMLFRRLHVSSNFSMSWPTELGWNQSIIHNIGLCYAFLILFMAWVWFLWNILGGGGSVTQEGICSLEFS